LVRHDAVPAEDLMQAFLYRHLTPSQELMVAARGKRPPPMKIAGATPIRVPPGGTAEVCVNVPQRLLDRGLDFELSDPLPGITLEKVTQAEGAVVLLLKADAHSAHSRDNLIVEAFTAPRPQRAGQAAKPPARTSLGFLPAIPIAIAPG
jgi:hypothetical protein